MKLLFDQDSSDSTLEKLTASLAADASVIGGLVFGCDANNGCDYLDFDDKTVVVGLLSESGSAYPVPT